MDLTEAEDIKRWHEYKGKKKLYKKNLNDPDNHDGMITHLEPDILECKVKWALGSITINKVVEVMEFQLRYCKSWKMMLWECYMQYASNFGKLRSGHRTRKGQVSFQSQRKAMPKNVQTTTQLQNGSPHQCSCLENPRDGEPGGLPSMGSHRVGHDWSDLAVK